MAKRDIASNDKVSLSMEVENELASFKKEKIIKFLEDTNFFSIVLIFLTNKRRFANDKTVRFIDEIIKEIKYKYPERWI